MNKKDLSYKKYFGSIEPSIEDNCLFGRILHIDDQIIYEGNTVAELKSAFELAVDNYLEYCEKTGKAANKTYSGTFNIRTGIDRHKRIAVAARARKINLNEYVNMALDAFEEKSVQSAQRIFSGAKFGISGVALSPSPDEGIAIMDTALIKPVRKTKIRHKN